MDNNRADKLIKTINDFKKSSIGQNISIHGKAYSLVSTRVAIARRNLGSSLDIKTTLLYQDDKKVIVKADIFIDEKHMASGLAEEVRTASRINNTSALENAETSAAGRALAFLGLLTDGIPSAEEISSALAQQDKQLQTALKELEGAEDIVRNFDDVEPGDEKSFYVKIIKAINCSEENYIEMSRSASQHIFKKTLFLLFV